MSSKESKKFYITTTLPYVNSEPHIGFAMEIIRADVIARYKKSLDYDVFFNTGTDEHGAKLHEVAQKEGISTQEFVDRNTKKFKELLSLLNISKDIHFIRTTDDSHKKACQEMWRRCKDNGFIYKKNYQSKYCVGCELNKTDSELVNGLCPLHPDRPIELIDEENYFFKFSSFEAELKKLYDDNENFVIPNFRFNEIKAFVNRGLEDFSISRLKSKMPWGVEVPDDKEHVMYVWFDALTNYISTLGWPDENGDFRYWTEGDTVQYCGKDNLRQQSAMWQAMLMAANIKNTDRIIIDGFITGTDGQKMSKSVGNVISPFEVIDTFKNVTDFPEDVLRFVLLHDIPSFEDGGISLESIKLSYLNNLVNGIGNFTSRVIKMAISNDLDIKKYLLIWEEKMNESDEYNKMYNQSFTDYNLKKAVEVVMQQLSWLDKDIQSNQPFKVIKTNPKQGGEMILGLVKQLAEIAHTLAPILPNTSAKILECIRENKMPEKPLFARL